MGPIRWYGLDVGHRSGSSKNWASGHSPFNRQSDRPHTLIYRDLIVNLASSHAQLYADANRSGVEHIRRWVDKLSIDCDFERKDAYVYTDESSRREEVEAEAGARVASASRPIAAYGPLPLKLLAHCDFGIRLNLIRPSISSALPRPSRQREDAFSRNPGDQSRSGQPMANLGRSRSSTGGARHRCHQLPDRRTGVVRSDHTAALSYCHGLSHGGGAAIEGMFIGIDKPTHSLRIGRDRDGPLLVVLGPSFNTGHDGDVAERFRD